MLTLSLRRIRMTTNVIVNGHSESRAHSGQPLWHAPVPRKPIKLRVRNSLAKTPSAGSGEDGLCEFVTSSGTKKLTWYCCGPTVYDAGHMGHARNFVTTDVLRRILRDYFGYDVVFVQNVTDIDDKIIVRARQLHLFEEYKKQAISTSCSDLGRQLSNAWQVYRKANLPKSDESLDGFAVWSESVDLPAELESNPKFAMHLAILKRSALAILNHSSFESLMEDIKDMFVPFLDAEKGSTVTDLAIFKNLASYWERHFDTDMQTLNVMPPKVITRVSEYIPQIITFTEGIIRRGYAYETGGSVYFDTMRYDSGKHHYAKLEPGNKANVSLISEGEGVLTEGKTKRSVSDFALWKASKAGEPSWNSPWGNGRPGWHIECSVMASEVLGSNIDIHSGGSDLAFPHHDNELAQSEAFYDCDQWINYFLHTGHLHIEGQKMSKSLKNFISIREAVEKYSVKSLRLAFLMQQWDRPMDFKHSFMNEVRGIENSFTKYFDAVKGIIAEEEEALQKGKNISRFLRDEDKTLLEALMTASSDLHVALSNNFDTPRSIAILSTLVTNAWKHIKLSPSASAPLLYEATRWMTDILSIFGLPMAHIGWATLDDSSTGRETVAAPFARVLSRFRDHVRTMAVEKAPHNEFLQECDRVRDVDLVELGVVLDDREGGAALVKFVDRERLLRERNEKDLREAERLEKKELARIEAQRKRVEKLAKGKIDPKTMFCTPEYTEWDDRGIPTTDTLGDLSKGKRKKLQKEYEMQEKLYKEFLESELANSN